MHILMCSGLYEIGGFSIVIEKLTDNLIKKGHEVTIGALKYKNIPSNKECNIVTLPISNILNLKRLLMSFDILHNHHPITNYLSLISQKPFFYHYHGAPDFGAGTILKVSMVSSIKITRNYVDAVIAISDTARSELLRDFYPKKIFTLYNGVDTLQFKPGLSERYRKGQPQFLFVGNLYEHKNIGELILAIKKLLNIYPNTHLLIVGKGRMLKHLQHLINSFKLNKHIELVGNVTNYELPFYYSSCDVYVTASNWELFGLPLLEAMACGKPIVASSIQAHIELLRKSKAGLIYRSGNLSELCEMMIFAFERSLNYYDNGLFFAQKHDWSNVTERLLNIYSQVLIN